ncbi:MAG TPA: AgmX/PglI C-terminal domain-containing protein [Myxococcaceae bacterium]|nr:AgmX/PglI C-terminal domain-containing protein [Myxococcaceae bacterium]
MDSRDHEHAEHPLGGEWLYRKGELVLGPVHGPQLLDRLYAGDINGQTEVALVGEDFERITHVYALRVHLAKAEAKWRVDALERRVRDRARRQRNVRLSMLAGVALVVAGVAGAVARYMAVHGTFDKRTEEAAIAVEPPVIRLAKARKQQQDEMLDYPLDKGGRRPAPGGTRVAGLGGTRPAGGAPENDPDDVSIEAKFDRGSIQTVISQRQRTLYPCFAEEARRSPGLSDRIPIEFVIGNDGQVKKLWVDHPRFADGDLRDCLLKELQRWPFRPYEGQQATVGLSFTIGRGAG